MTGATPTPEITIRPANHATWQDLEAIFGTAD
jgi:hypothetical protein